MGAKHMPCYRPIPAYQDRPGGTVTLHPPVGTEHLLLPCGSCIGCQTAHAAEWANRAQHEAKRWAPYNAMLTLTYDDGHLPDEGHLRADHLRCFLQQLRNRARR